MLGRIIAIALGLPLLAVGSIGLLSVYLPDLSLTREATAALQAGVRSLSGLGVPSSAARGIVDWIGSPALRFTLAPIGLVFFGFGVLHRGSGKIKQPRESDSEDAIPVDKKGLKKAQKAASALARKGNVVDAAEMLFSSGALEKAAEYFIKAGELTRAAEIRHDQNRFVESAELYLQAGKHESAGAIFAQQDEFVRAAECYLEIDHKSVAAEMFEKAGDFQRAADCYRDVEFLRHAAQCYVKCKAWADAGQSLELVFTEESSKSKGDEKKLAELKKLVRQAGKLYERAGDLEAAQRVLDKGGCALESAEIALRLEQFAKAAELFRDAGEAERAAQALRLLGENEEAARVLGEHHRDAGEYKQAAEFLEEAGDLLAAGDLYRQLESYEEAGRCYERQSEFAQAAEMYRMAGDSESSAACYERAGRFAEAADVHSQLGSAEKEAELLEKAGQFLRAGEVYHREGIDDEAIKVLQKVDSASEEFARASALLGDIFRSRGQLSLAIKKLKQAIGDQELSRDSLPVYYTLATLYGDNDDVAEAVEIYEKILALEYHYEDVEERLVRAREVLKDLPAVDSTAQDSSTSRGFASSAQPGRYQIVGELGRGGMGIVYKAKDTVLDRLVAYKVLPDTLKENPQALKNFLREAKAAAKLNHPGIVTVYDTGEQEGRYYIAMEYVDGTTLKEILRRRGVIAPAGILHVLVQVCEALAYAHDKKVVHRDIKSANTMWTRDKKAKIMDFGLAKVVEEVRNHTTVVSGTPYYMSPEQTLGKNIDHRTDIYSLGVTVFEMATGTVPFREGNIPYHHVHTPPPDIRDLRSELPDALAAVVSRCLQKDPAKRYQSTREILSEVRVSLTNTGTRSSSG